MRKPLLAASTVALVTSLLGQPAGAINSYNAAPAPDHTEVGAFIALWDGDDADAVPDRFDWVCSGTMVDGDTFLTAAHCTDDWPADTRFFVSLDDDVQSVIEDATDGRTGAEAAAWAVAEGHVVEGAAHQDAAYPGPASDPHDIGVLEVDPTAMAHHWSFAPAQLPTAGLLDSLGGRQLDAHDWMVVGYGTQEAARGPGGLTYPGGGVRLKAPLDFNALNKTWVRLSMSKARGLGGACYGDSGGPNFVEVGGALILVATTVTGDTPCYATNVAYRMDTPSARAFLAQYVKLP